jgi:hypothetical protein
MASTPARCVGRIKSGRQAGDGEVALAIHSLARRALTEAALRRLDRLPGVPARPIGTLFNGAAVQPVAQDGQTAGGMTLAELIEGFETETTPRIRFSKRVE